MLVDLRISDFLAWQYLGNIHIRQKETEPIATKHLVLFHFKGVVQN